MTSIHPLLTDTGHRDDPDVLMTWLSALAAERTDETLIAACEVVAARRGWHPVLALQAIRAAFDPDMHPRGRDGKWIEKLGMVSLFNVAGAKSGQRAQVTGIKPNPKSPGDPDITVRLVNDDGQQGPVFGDVKPHNIEQAPEKARLVNSPDQPEPAPRFAMKQADLDKLGTQRPQPPPQYLGGQTFDERNMAANQEAWQNFADATTAPRAAPGVTTDQVLADYEAFKAQEAINEQIPGYYSEEQPSRRPGLVLPEEQPGWSSVDQPPWGEGGPAEREAMRQRLPEGGPQPADTVETSTYIPGVGDVYDYVAAHPQMEGEALFEWQSRIVEGLPPRAKHDVLFEIRERYSPVDFIADGAARWRAEHGLPEPSVDISEIPANQLKGYAVARAFESTPDQSTDPRVQAAYAEFIAQSDEMFDFMTRPEAEGGMGISVEFWTNPDPSQFGVGPYLNATDQAEDLRLNHHIFLEAGLGGEHEATMTREQYDRFRAVHDVFGHAGIGGGFDRHGEYQAYLQHASMYDGDGRRAMASEYHGVNSAMWSGLPDDPGGTGKSILLPDELIAPPWDKRGNYAPPPSPRELSAFIDPAEFEVVFPLIAAGQSTSTPLQLQLLGVSKETADAVACLANEVGLDADFANRFDKPRLHSLGPAAETAAGLVARGQFDPDMHPRGRDGKFIEAFGLVELFDVPGRDPGERGQVTRIVPDPKTPGRPNVQVKLFDPGGPLGLGKTVVVKPDNIGAAPEKARLDVDLSEGGGLSRRRGEPQPVAPVGAEVDLDKMRAKRLAREARGEAAPGVSAPTSPRGPIDLRAPGTTGPPGRAPGPIDLRAPGVEEPEGPRPGRGRLLYPFDLTGEGPEGPAQMVPIPEEPGPRMLGGRNQTTITPEEARSLADDVINGKPIEVNPPNLDDVIEHFADHPEAVDLTLMPPFNQMRNSPVQIPRSEMPQIAKELLADFQERLRNDGIGFAPDAVNPGSLTATQAELDGKNVGGMMRSARDGSFDPTKDPIWISSDGKVLDGHHRWAAATALSTNCPQEEPDCVQMPVIRVNMPMSELLAYANRFNDDMGVERKAFGTPTAPTPSTEGGSNFSAPVASGMRAAGPPVPDQDGNYTMATDAEDGITAEYLADPKLYHGKPTEKPAPETPAP